MANKFALLAVIFSFVLVSCSDGSSRYVQKNPIRVSNWEVACKADRKTGDKSCYARNKILPPTCSDTCITYSIVLANYDKNGVSFDFGPSDEGTVQIDNNAPLTYSEQDITGEKAKSLLAEMLNGKYGHSKTTSFGGGSYNYDFSLAGFKEAYAKMQELYNEKIPARK